jgi:hypothetical protein
MFVPPSELYASQNAQQCEKLCMIDTDIFDGAEIE